ATPGELFTTLALTGYYPVLTWTTYLLAGMAVGRLDLRDTRVAARLLGGGMLLAVLATAASTALRGIATGLGPAGRHYGTTPTDTWWWLVVDDPHSGTPFDLAHTIGTALAVLGLALLVAGWSRAAVWVPAAVGAAPLTLYTLHVGWLGVSPGTGLPTFLVHLAVAVLLGVALRLAGRRGPLETVVSAPGRALRRRMTSPGFP
ncbi:MAG: hypothetical protein L0I24_21050, partial [Pseudonocardia sp.]|nr:hypothetical protein [Pseudonocardia sp.]